MEFKSAFVAIVGRPNAGKSTILNSFVGEKLAAISSKPQTTRTKITGIITEDDYQLVFVDTPGVHLPKTRLGDYMNKSAMGAINGVDAAVLTVDAARDPGAAEEKIVSELRAQKVPTILAVNKIDKVAYEALLPLIDTYSKMMDFETVIPVSATKGDGMDKLFDEIKKHLVPGPMFYPEDMITDKTEREIAAEILREKLLRLLEQEIPHGIAVEIEEMKDEENIIKISANIFCEKSSHKAIVIGKKGDMLKKIGTYAREDMEKFFGKKIFLQLWVKIRDDWRNNNFMLKNMGFSGKE